MRAGTPARIARRETSCPAQLGFHTPRRLDLTGEKISPAPCPFRKVFGERKEALTVKKIFPTLALTAMFSLASCGWFGSPEAYKSESGRTTFRAADERPSEPGQVTPSSQKIPGESR